MCFKSPQNPPPPSPTLSTPQWWINTPPKLVDPKVRLNEEATEAAKKKRRAIGTRKLQIPLTSNSASGLGIPTK